jgi:hypothetical protein
MLLQYHVIKYLNEHKSTIVNGLRVTKKINIIQSEECSIK